MEKHYIKRIIDGGPPEWVHSLFTRYGRGEYTGPSCEIKIKAAAGFKSTYDYAHAFGHALCFGGGTFKAKGCLYSKLDFRRQLEDVGIGFTDNSSPKKGYFVADIDGEDIDAGVLKSMYEAVPWATALLSMSGDAGRIKSKKKPPKPGKEKALDFVSGSIKDEASISAMNELVLFEPVDYNMARIVNTYVIESLDIPDGMDAAKARIEAKRRGKLIREVELDGSLNKSTYDLLV